MLNKSNTIKEDIITWRRDFHAHPELGFDVHRTAARVADILEGFGYRVLRGVGKTGVVGDIGEGRPVVAIRADMDALPIQELNETEYTSQDHGKMHACGHDAHTAMALGAARILAKENFTGRVRFLFQPSEEIGDSEGKSGAGRMIEDGCMEGVDYVIAQHVDPDVSVGTIRIGAGPASGGVDDWFAIIRGVGGHCAHPEKAIDPFYLVAHVIFALYAINSRKLNPFASSVVSIGSVNGGFTENVIPETVKITGTLRYADPSIQKIIHAEIRNAFELAKTLGGDYELLFQIGCPPMINDMAVSGVIAQVGNDLLGPECVCPPENSLGAEDFGSFMEYAPGAMYTLGAQIEDGTERHLHHPRFDIDERALTIGAAILAETTIRLLNMTPKDIK